MTAPEPPAPLPPGQPSRLASALDLGAALAALALFVAAPMRPSLIQSFDHWLCSGALGLFIDVGAYQHGLARTSGPPWSLEMCMLATQVLAGLLMAYAVVAGLVPRRRAWARLIGVGAAASLLFGEKPFLVGFRPLVMCDGLRFVPLLVTLIVAMLLLEPAIRHRCGSLLARAVGVLGLLLLVAPNCSVESQWSLVPWGSVGLVLSLSLPLLLLGLDPESDSSLAQVTPPA